MKKISELNFGFNNAGNYRHRENKMLFNEIFVKSKFLDEVLKSNTYFIIGIIG